MATPEPLNESRVERTQDIKETGRLEAFSDGVFAVAITLLVFNIPIPHSFPADQKDAWGYIGMLWPQYLAYVLSFVTILIMWSNHHLIFRLIQRTNQLFLMLNGLLLMSITFLNFPTGLLGASLQNASNGSGGAGVAAFIYNGTLIVISVLFNVLWRYATYKGRLLDSRADPALVATIHRQYRVGPFVYVVPFLLALPAYPLSIAIDIALAVYFALTGSIHRTPRRNPQYDPMEKPVTPR